MKALLGGLIIATGLATSAGAAVNLVSNGSFETGYTGGGSFYTVSGASIPSWSISSGNVDWISGYWPAQQGSKSLDMNGNQLGTISQTITGVTQGRYELSFWVAANTDGPPTPKTLNVSVVDGSNTSLLADVVSASVKPPAGWTNYIAQFLYLGAPTTLTLSFVSGSVNNVNGFNAFGPALDNVSIAAVPEPSTWAMMLLGFGAAGVWAYRRRKVAAPVAA